uniref:Uncharacterized protein n=1 Tax=Romanomermis culicivorax TaxID=13658 RepID=A0A915KQG6_ROMCU
MDQLASATPYIIDTTPRARTHQKTIGPLTTRRHFHLDDRPPQICPINLDNTRMRTPFFEGPPCHVPTNFAQCH